MVVVAVVVVVVVVVVAGGTLFPTFSRCTESGAENSPPAHQNTMAVKDGHGSEGRTRNEITPKNSLTSLLKPYSK